MMKTEFNVKVPGGYESPCTSVQNIVPEGLVCASTGVGHAGYDPDEIEFDFGW